MVLIQRNVCTCPTLMNYKSRAFCSLSLTPLLAGFINRPLCFLSNPQRAQDSLKAKSGTRNHLGGEG